jgi:hypothetical protein
MEDGYRVHLANHSAIKQYEGLKHSDDTTDAFHLAQLLTEIYTAWELDLTALLHYPFDY